MAVHSYCIRTCVTIRGAYTSALPEHTIDAYETYTHSAYNVSIRVAFILQKEEFTNKEQLLYDYYICKVCVNTICHV